MEMEYKYKVVTRCFTYNHALYIEDALNGFVMQETSFPVISVIVDDASTDGEQDVILNYLEEQFQKPYRKEETDYARIICANHKTNPNCNFVVVLLKYNHFSIKKAKLPYISEWMDNAEYHALCEGDDYWIDPLKLQLQVDFLESHSAHSMCVHAFRKDIYNKDSFCSIDEHKFDGDTEIIPDESVLEGTGLISATASMLYRTSAILNYPQWAIEAPVGDRPRQLVLFSRGHIGYLDKVMSVYRVGVPGSWTLRVLNKKDRSKINSRMIKMHQDFDEWTNGRYHYLIKKGIRNFKKTIRKEKRKRFLRSIVGHIQRWFK